MRRFSQWAFLALLLYPLGAKGEVLSPPSSGLALPSSFEPWAGHQEPFSPQIPPPPRVEVEILNLNQGQIVGGKRTVEVKFVVDFESPEQKMSYTVIGWVEAYGLSCGRKCWWCPWGISIVDYGSEKLHFEKVLPFEWPTFCHHNEEVIFSAHHFAYYTGWIPTDEEEKYQSKAVDNVVVRVQNLEVRGVSPEFLLFLDQDRGIFPSISYELVDAKDKHAHVLITIYDLDKGKPVRTLVDAERSMGHHKEVWDGKDDFGNPVEPGIYTFQIVAWNEEEPPFPQYYCGSFHWPWLWREWKFDQESGEYREVLYDAFWFRSTLLPKRPEWETRPGLYVETLDLENTGYDFEQEICSLKLTYVLFDASGRAPSYVEAKVFSPSFKVLDVEFPPRALGEEEAEFQLRAEEDGTYFFVVLARDSNALLHKNLRNKPAFPKNREGCRIVELTGAVMARPDGVSCGAVAAWILYRQLGGKLPWSKFKKFLKKAAAICQRRPEHYEWCTWRVPCPWCMAKALSLTGELKAISEKVKRIEMVNRCYKEIDKGRPVILVYREEGHRFAHAVVVHGRMARGIGKNACWGFCVSEQGTPHRPLPGSSIKPWYTIKRYGREEGVYGVVYVTKLIKLRSCAKKRETIPCWKG